MLTFNKQVLELAFQGENHGDDNIFVGVSKQTTPILADIIIPGYVPFFGMGLSSSSAGYIRAHDQVLTYPFEIFIGGHIAQRRTRQDIQVQQKYVQDLFESCKDAILHSPDPNLGFSSKLFVALLPKQTLGIVGADFVACHRELASYCRTRTASRWTDRLIAGDVYEMDNVLVMLGYLRSDNGILRSDIIRR